MRKFLAGLVVGFLSLFAVNETKAAFVVEEGYPGFFDVICDGSNDYVNVHCTTTGVYINYVFYEGAEIVSIFGNGGQDTIRVSQQNTYVGIAIDGGDGSDTITLWGSGAVYGGEGGDTIDVRDARGDFSVVFGDGGYDKIYIRGNTGNLDVYGGYGGDIIDCSQNQFPVKMHGNEGDDDMIGSSHPEWGDVVSGGSGWDTFTNNGSTNDSIDSDVEVEY